MNSKDYRNIREAYLNVYEQEEALLELTGSKGHPGYKAGSKDLGPMQSGHSADSEKRKDKGGTMSQRYGDHLGDIDDKDGDDSEYEPIVKQQSRDSRANVRNPLRNKVKAARKVLSKESYDLYDIILSHLISEGYADTEQAAEAIMVNMSEEWRESIVETRMDPRGRPASGPMNVYANPKGKPSQAHLDAVKSYDAEQKKKTPEQRKAEQDAYRERQMNNK